jgi:hypothetical protein
MTIERAHLTKRQLLAALPDSGAPGRTSYAVRESVPALDGLGLEAEDVGRLAEVAGASDTGCVLFARAADVTLIVPPFPVEEAVTYSELWPPILVELLERRRVVAVCLLRLGGFSAGVFRGESLVDSKTAQRFVKNRHRKGGQSQRRFERIREKQVHELFGMACEESREKLGPYEEEIQHVFFGGDRRTLQAFRKECPYYDEVFGSRLMRRVLAVPGDPRRALLEAMPREVWASEVYRVDFRLEGGR